MKLRKKDLERIAIFGPSGSGKTTICNRLGKILKIPIFHLDDIFWLPNWQEPELEVFRVKVYEILNNNNCWIIDGNYSKVRDKVLDKATLAIVLNLPLPLILWRILTRTIARKTNLSLYEYTPLPKAIHENNQGEPFLQAIYDLSKYAIKFKRKNFTKIIDELNSNNVNYIILNKNKEIDIIISILKRKFK